MDLSVSEVRLADRRLFTGFIRDITERKRLEREILEISEREQRRIGQDLHDGLCQHLAGIELMSQVLEQKLVTALERRRRARRATSPKTSAMPSARRARWRAAFRRSPWNRKDSCPRCRNWPMNTEEIFRVPCRFDCNPPVPCADHAVATHLFRIGAGGGVQRHQARQSETDFHSIDRRAGADDV